MINLHERTHGHLWAAVLCHLPEKKRIRRASRGEERKKQRKVKEKEIEEILTYMPPSPATAESLHIYTMWTLVKKGAKKFNVFKIEVV